MSNRIRVITSVIKTREELERVVRETVRHQLAREARITERDKAIAVIGEGHNKLIDGYTTKIESNLALIEQWSDAHRSEFGRDRSIAIEGNRIGWRLGQPQPKPCKKLTWRAVLDRIFDLTEDIQNRLIRTKHEPNKEAMLAIRESEPEVLEAIGVEIVQAETFYLDPNREGQPDVRLVAEAKEAA